MNTIIEKIRAEVERQLKNTHDWLNGKGAKKGCPRYYEMRGRESAFDSVLSRLSDLEKEEKPTLQEQPVKIDIRKELASIEFMGVNDARDTETIARHFYALGQQSKEQPVDWQKVAEAHAKDQPLGQDNDGNLVYLQEHPVWHNVEKETPTSFGEGVIVLCKNKNKEDGIWLTDFIPCWEGEWKPRDNWETPVKWAYVRDFYPKAEQSVTLSVKDAMKALDEKIAKVKKAGSWKNPELLDEMRAEQPVCDELEEEIKRYGKEEMPIVLESDLNDLARHFAQWGAEHRGSSETPNDLEEAAVEYSAIGYSPFDDPYEKNQQFECSKFAFIAGAKWQMKKDLSSINKSYESGVVFGMNAQKEQDEKELSEKIASAYQLGLADKEKQMLKEAVEGHILGEIRNQEEKPYEIYAESDFLPLNGKFKMGDKVKIIIVKED